MIADSGSQLTGDYLIGFLSTMQTPTSALVIFCAGACYLAMIAFSAAVAMFSDKKARRNAAIKVLRTLLLRRPER
ncbi:hypothetical protein [Amycolatopsis azurea]|uniref:hypothetical protein n=1 Tax=Amycolatopsis azurea TaxID=36819 RepID=UPI00117744BE|nr:hypothetical protein [Amycolatopsis azurea]